MHQVPTCRQTDSVNIHVPGGLSQGSFPGESAFPGGFSLCTGVCPTLGFTSVPDVICMSELVNACVQVHVDVATVKTCNL